MILTDNEIKKALECCANANINSCDDCPFDKRCQAGENLCKPVLDLLNRRDAEIERLGEDIEAYKDSIESLLSIVNSNYQNGRIDAIKEFAERLKAEMLKSKYNLTVSSYSRACNDVLNFWIEEIDNLVKEMNEKEKDK